MPIRTDGSTWEVVQGVELDEFSRAKVDSSVAELVSEREAVADLIPS
jgi:malate dehydrogenase